MKKDQVSNLPDVSDIIPSIVSAESNKELQAFSSEEEIFKAI